MPSVTQEIPAVPTKKRRRDDENNNSSSHQGDVQQLPFVNSNYNNNNARCSKTHEHGSLFHQPSHLPAAAIRKMMPIPNSKRQRMSWSNEDTEEVTMRSPSASPTAQKQQQQTIIRVPASAFAAATAWQDGKFDINSRPLPTPARTNASIMSRCHICFRKPSKKSDLDSFADCQGCGQRTCYVCIRECLGWRPPSPLHDERQGNTITEDSFTMLDVDADADNGNNGAPNHDHQPRPQKQQTSDGWARGGHRQMVCSRCCVERGSDGDVVCLGCLPFIEG
ncbi:hypothetical protein QBC46DRAFT_361670 [Diplogelasinospora grovesii]|uniref:Uncharacterized protein n=1 Tax=Diplogelasinospora grovesii TaxID=303347 RepID=A0AAN6NF33_9PEZI|nr:hypothetical protein QBC46DRAFT_361670 [Diplogelasinospora grovesii]